MSRQQQTVILLKSPELNVSQPQTRSLAPSNAVSSLHWHGDPQYSCVLLCGYLICLAPMLDLSFSGHGLCLLSLHSPQGLSSEDTQQPL